MAVQLFEHNAKAYQATVKMMQQYGKTAIVHPTATYWFQPSTKQRMVSGWGVGSMSKRCFCADSHRS